MTGDSGVRPTTPTAGKVPGVARLGDVPTISRGNPADDKTFA